MLPFIVARLPAAALSPWTVGATSISARSHSRGIVTNFYRGRDLMRTPRNEELAVRANHVMLQDGRLREALLVPRQKCRQQHRRVATVMPTGTPGCEGSSPATYPASLTHMPARRGQGMSVRWMRPSAIRCLEPLRGAWWRASWTCLGSQRTGANRQTKRCSRATP